MNRRDQRLGVATERVATVNGIERAKRFLQSATVGQGLRLGQGKLAVVVGDVTGHGMAAAADMALIRGMITALLHSGVAVASPTVLPSARSTTSTAVTAIRC